MLVISHEYEHREPENRTREIHKTTLKGPVYSGSQRHQTDNALDGLEQSHEPAIYSVVGAEKISSSSRTTTNSPLAAFATFKRQAHPYCSVPLADGAGAHGNRRPMI